MWKSDIIFLISNFVKINFPLQLKFKEFCYWIPCMYRKCVKYLGEMHNLGSNSQIQPFPFQIKQAIANAIWKIDLHPHVVFNLWWIQFGGDSISSLFLICVLALAQYALSENGIKVPISVTLSKGTVELFSISMFSEMFYSIKFIAWHSTEVHASQNICYLTIFLSISNGLQLTMFSMKALICCGTLLNWFNNLL